MAGIGMGLLVPSVWFQGHNDLDRGKLVLLIGQHCPDLRTLMDFTISMFQASLSEFAAWLDAQANPSNPRIGPGTRSQAASRPI